MDAIITVWLTKSGEKPDHPSAVVFDKQTLRSLFLGILANHTDFPLHYEFPCQADDKNAPQPTLESLLGSAIYRKSEGKLEARMATGPLVGLLEQLFPSWA